MQALNRNAEHVGGFYFGVTVILAIRKAAHDSAPADNSFVAVSQHSEYRVNFWGTHLYETLQ